MLTTQRGTKTQPSPPGLAHVVSGFSLSDKFDRVVAATLKTAKPPPGLAGKCEDDQVLQSHERQKGKHTFSGPLRRRSPESTAKARTKQKLTEPAQQVEKVTS